MKRTLLKFMMNAGVFAPFRLANRNRALILMYHRFSESDGGAATSARAFAEQVRYLTTHYHVVPLGVLADHLASDSESLPPRLAAITIDDGYRDVCEIAFPILQRYNAHATLFVVTDFLDRKAWVWTDKLRYLTSRTKLTELALTIDGRSLNLKLSDAASRLAAASRVNSILKLLPDAQKNDEIARLSSLLEVPLPDAPPAEFAPLTWDEAREMDRTCVQIESHTSSHPILTQIDDERLRLELCESRARVEAELEREADLFCYPNGDYDARVRGAVERAGYRCAVTTDYGMNEKGQNLLSLRRICAEADLPHFIQSTSGFEQMKIRLTRNVETNRLAQE
jgi:peptidoglycan/xylan/chitin deacetylase (PgdA/CDA1 family)